MSKTRVLLALFALWAGAAACKKKDKPAAEPQEQAEQQEAEDQDLTPEEMEVVEEE